VGFRSLLVEEGDLIGVRGDNGDDGSKQEQDLSGLEAVKFPNDMCVLCWGNRRYHRTDSLRRHLIGVHFKHMANGAAIHCSLHSSRIKGGWTDPITFLHHTATLDYDPKIRRDNLQRCRPPSSTNFGSKKDLKIEMTTDLTADSTTNVIRSGTPNASLLGRL
jgi:hypothetical protein